MPKKSSDFFDQSETGNWNVAADYTKFKIMKHLYAIDEFQITAKFGTLEMINEFMVNDNMKNIARLKAIRRFVNALQLVIENTRFAVKIKNKDKEKLEGYYETLQKIEKVLPALESSSFDQRTKRTIVKIDEKKFEKVLEHLIEIKTSLNEPLNNADLIFYHTEEFDPKAAKEEMKKRLTEVG